MYCNLATGLWDAKWTGDKGDAPGIRNASCAVKLSDGTMLAAADYPRHACLASDAARLSDAFGKGLLITIHHTVPGRPELRQRFYVYPVLPYFFGRLEIVGHAPVTTNDISPLLVDDQHTRGAGLHLDAEDKPRTLFVPFDNDRFVRFNSDYPTFSNEATAVFDNATRHGFVVGSVTHDVWKTGIDMGEFAPKSLGRLRVYGGAADKWSQDT